MAIDEQYASPGLRWGLLQDDYPGATNEFRLVTADGIPGGHPFARDDERFVLCTITFPEGTGKSPAYGWKPLSEARKSDDESYAALRTKALGRAIKDAGYPDKLPDLKALTIWRKRTAEVAALAAGHVQAIDSTEHVMAALEAAAESTPDATSHDERGSNDDIDDAEIVEEPAAVVINDSSQNYNNYDEIPSPTAPQFSVGDGFDEKRSELMEVIMGLEEEVVTQLKDFASQNGMPEDLSMWNEEALDHLEAWLAS